MAERTDCDDVPAVLPSRSPRYENQSIERAFGILEAISDAPKALTLAEIVNRTGLDRATAYRLLAVLVRLRLLHKDAAAAR